MSRAQFFTSRSEAIRHAGTFAPTKGAAAAELGKASRITRIRERHEETQKTPRQRFGESKEPR